VIGHEGHGCVATFLGIFAPHLVRRHDKHHALAVRQQTRELAVDRVAELEAAAAAQ
jgi:hypothetical protein